MKKRGLAAFIMLVMAGTSSAEWPGLREPAPAVGGGERDAAVVVGVEKYAFVPEVPGARLNAEGWRDYLTQTREVPGENVFLLRDAGATAESMEDAVVDAAERVQKGGTLWFVFVGHGAPSADGTDGLLVGVDAQQKAKSLPARSLSRGKLLGLLGESKAENINVLIDACFSGTTRKGKPLLPGIQPLVVTSPARAPDFRFTILSAAHGDQFAGDLPDLERPAFSYLLLGGVRGWADWDDDGAISAGELIGYSSRILSERVRDREQTPLLVGEGGRVLVQTAGEAEPDASPAPPAAESVRALPEPAPEAEPKPGPEEKDWGELLRFLLQTGGVADLDKFGRARKFLETYGFQKSRYYAPLLEALPKGEVFHAYETARVLSGDPELSVDDYFRTRPVTEKFELKLYVKKHKGRYERDITRSDFVLDEALPEDERVFIRALNKCCMYLNIR